MHPLGIGQRLRASTNGNSHKTRYDGLGARFMSCKCNEIAWQNPSRPIPTNLLANLIKKIGTIAPYLSDSIAGQGTVNLP